MVNIKIQQLKYFVAVVEAGGHRAAARALNRSQSALSSALKTLEGQLGSTLFESGHHMQLTPFGETFYIEACHLLSAYERFQRTTHTLAKGGYGELRIASVPSIAVRMMPDILQNFTQRFPNVRVHMMDDRAAGIAQRLIQGEVDMAIGNPSYIDQAEIDFNHLLSDTIGVVCHRRHRLAQAESVSWRMLQEFPFIRNGTAILLKGTPAQSLSENASYIIDNLVALFSILSLNIGVTTLPRLAYMSAYSQELCWLPFTDLPIHRDIGIFKLKRKTLSPPAQVFYDLCEEMLHSAGEKGWRYNK